MTVAEIGFAAPSCMVAVGMRDHGLFHGLPGVNVKIPFCTVKPFVCEFDKRHRLKKWDR